VKLWRLRPPLYCMLKSRRLGRRVKSQGVRVGKALVLVHLETFPTHCQSHCFSPLPSTYCFYSPTHRVLSPAVQIHYLAWSILETGSLHCSHTAEAARVVGSAKLEGVKCPFNCTHDSPATHQPQSASSSRDQSAFQLLSFYPAALV